ncbi:winged helix-turn-helix transcriptional regulator [Haloglomus salinum]|jgi:DNA-binding HxlR family transcriptional regulator|uniref:winged helix-turn-helix transcriptional regulator n=1 Tax=Haloglomus salinum TaxID=2962673 RepID=UPI0020C95357|nr:helix-turn-helix domain-containing protein [Haloglomus salinum]
MEPTSSDGSANESAECPPDGRDGPDRAVAALLALLGKRHTLAILYRFASDSTPWRFGELETDLGISPTTLSERLTELTAAGFLDRHSYDERPPRVEYTATPRLEGLKPAFTELYRWSGEYGPVSVD